MVLGLLTFFGLSSLAEPLSTGSRGPDLWWLAVTPVGLLLVVALASVRPVMGALRIEPASLMRE